MIVALSVREAIEWIGSSKAFLQHGHVNLIPKSIIGCDDRAPVGLPMPSNLSMQHAVGLWWDDVRCTPPGTDGIAIVAVSGQGRLPPQLAMLLSKAGADTSTMVYTPLRGIVR